MIVSTPVEIEIKWAFMLNFMFVPLLSLSAVTCPPTEVQCVQDGGCISSSKICDKVLDCSDGSDERQCDFHIGK